MISLKTNLFARGGDVVRAPKQRLQKGERSEIGGVWFICVLPLLGLVLEMFAVDRYSGAALWLSVIGMTYFGCFADLKHIRQFLTEDEYQRLKRSMAVPFIYIARRDKIRTGEGYKGFVMAALAAAALFANGFTQGLILTPDKIQERLENSTVDILENFSGTSDATVSEQLELWFDDGEYEGEASKSGDDNILVFSGKHKGKAYEVTITVEHDGFAYKSIRATSVKLDGEELDEDEFKETIKGIFISSYEEPTDEETSVDNK